MVSVALIVFQLIFHPFHVSVTEVKYKEDRRSLQISSRIFLDDLELALRGYTGDENLDITDEGDWEFLNERLGNYLVERISFKDQKGRKYPISYVGAEIEEDVMWCYLEIEKVKKLSRIEVTNEVITEVWSDQENLVHFRAFEKVKSARLYKGESSTVFEWE